MLNITEPNQEVISFRNRLEPGTPYAIKRSKTRYSTSDVSSLSTTGSLVDLENPLIDPSYNVRGNYTAYVTNTLVSIIQIKKALKNHPSFKSEIEQVENTDLNQSQNKKLLVLDLDETLVHADFEGIFLNHDVVLSFNSDGSTYTVGVFLRPGLHDFLQILKEKFDICIYTASSPVYADAIIDYLDPDKKIITKRLYRDDCININGTLFIKDISLLSKDYQMKDIVIVDNSLYSFMNHISNGILINSFYYDKSDLELYSVMNYLIDHVAKNDDVRDVNDQFFNFKQIMEEIEKEL